MSQYIACKDCIHLDPCPHCNHAGWCLALKEWIGDISTLFRVPEECVDFELKVEIDERFYSDELYEKWMDERNGL